MRAGLAGGNTTGNIVFVLARRAISDAGSISEKVILLTLFALGSIDQILAVGYIVITQNASLESLNKYIPFSTFSKASIGNRIR